jgi:UDPglucose 6-dehydrogenase
MNVAVFGLWHLGTVMAACLAEAGHDVTGLDPDRSTIDRLSAGTPPLFEPGLEDLVRRGLTRGALRFTTDASSALEHADVVWVTFDTPVDEEDRADVASVERSVASLFPFVRDGAVVVMSSQVPVGTTRKLAERFAHVANGRRVEFAYSPENLRLGKAIDAFTHPDRVVVGVSSAEAHARIADVLRPITDRIEWMSIESAEMTKHALNAFLATSVAFINEIAALCEKVGADAADVARGLKSETRIGPKAYLSPGGAFAGGTLARDVMFLSQLGAARGVPVHVLAAVRTSNDAHREWAQRRLIDVLGDVRGATVALWGLTYKPGTDTLRRSPAVELARWLHSRGARVTAHDPAVTALPTEVAAFVALSPDPLDAVDGAQALVITTPWPEFRAIDASQTARRMAGTLVLDANRFLAATLGGQPGLRYMSVGRAAA